MNGTAVSITLPYTHNYLSANQAHA